MLSKKIFMESDVYVIACYWEIIKFLSTDLLYFNCIFAFKKLQARRETHPLVL